MDTVATLPLLPLQGTSGEMGVEYGKTVPDLIGRNLEDYMRRFVDVVGLSEREVSSWGETFREVTREYKSSIADMIEGVAEGSGNRPEHVFALNARTEIIYSTVPSAVPSGDEECTSLAVLPSRTASGHTLLATNWDWHPEQSEVTLLFATQDEDGFSVLTLAEAGMLAKNGLNSAGLGLCANLLSSDRDVGGEGVPYHVLLRGVLESKTMADATRAALNHPRVSSGNFLIADSGGEAIDLEAVPGDFGYLVPQDGLVAHSNHFLAEVPVYDRKKAQSALTLIRPERVRHLLEEALQSKAVSEEDIRNVLRDHYSYPNGICRHVDERDPEHERICTVYSITMDLHDGAFSIAKGQPCEHEYETVRLSDLYAKEVVS
jgi:isopenicillin-N N-acyltransferase-like protein